MKLRGIAPEDVELGHVRELLAKQTFDGHAILVELLRREVADVENDDDASLLNHSEHATTLGREPLETSLVERYRLREARLNLTQLIFRAR